MPHILSVQRLFRVLTGALCLASACDSGMVTPNNDTGDAASTLCGTMPAEVLSGNITKNTTLSASKRWLLVGQVKVTERATLTIEPGTVVCGDATDPQRVSFLNIDQDAKLVADGTKDKPIVFTSSRKEGERRTSDWGGVVLRGRAAINLPPGNEQACGSLEGNAGSYGPCGTLKNDDSSGVLRYVRIEFAGREPDIAPLLQQVRGQMKALELPRVDETLALYEAITAPVLAVHASDDSLARWWKGRYSLQDFHQRLAHVPDVRQHWLEAAGHMLHHDQPEAVARLIEEFLN